MSPAQDNILEEIKKSEFADSSAAANDYASPPDKDPSDPKDSDRSLATGGSEEQLLLDPPLTEEEITADLSAIIDEAGDLDDLDDLDMMIQSASPFRGQNYVAHGNANSYHRQAPYHHHQVSKYSPFPVKSTNFDVISMSQLVNLNRHDTVSTFSMTSGLIGEGPFRRNPLDDLSRFSDNRRQTGHVLPMFDLYFEGTKKCCKETSRGEEPIDMFALRRNAN